MAIVPLTLLLIFLLLFFLYRNFKFPAIALVGVLMSAPVGGILALVADRKRRSRSRRGSASSPCSESRCRRRSSTSPTSTSCASPERRSRDAIREGAILRLRPIMMTALVAALGLLPAALATGVGTDTQRPFAVVIVGGLITCLADRHLPDARALHDGRARRRPPRGLTRPD